MKGPRNLCVLFSWSVTAQNNMNICKEGGGVSCIFAAEVDDGTSDTTVSLHNSMGGRYL